MAPSSSQLRLQAVAFISAQNHPIFIRSFSQSQKDDLKYHYIAHTSLDVIEERTSANTKSTECYLGLLYVMDDVAIYGYLAPSKLKLVIALALVDAVIRDTDVTMIFRALHMAYYQSLSNPFLRLDAPQDVGLDHSAMLVHGSRRWKGFKQRVDDIGRAVGAVIRQDD